MSTENIEEGMIMSGKSASNVLTLVLVIILSIGSGLGVWWFEKRFESLETQMMELERLGPAMKRLNRDLKSELSFVSELRKAVEATQKSLAPLVRVDRSLDLLSEKIGKDIAPATARIPEIASSLADVQTKLKALSAALSATQKDTNARITTSQAETVKALTGQTKLLASKLESKVSKLEPQLAAISNAQKKLTGFNKEFKSLSDKLNALTRTVDSLKKQLQSIERKLPPPRKPGPAA